MEDAQGSVLLVEGTGDKGVIIELLKAWEVPCPCIKECGSDGEVFKALKVYLSNPGLYRKVGVIVDADTKPEGRIQRFSQILAENGRYASAGKISLAADGLVVEGDDIDSSRLGLWVMPDNRGHGMLEDFLAEMASAIHPDLLDESERAIAHMEERGLQLYSPAHRPKAKIHTYLAWQKAPGCSLSQAVMKHYLDVTSDNARLFVEWIQRVFWK